VIATSHKKQQYARPSFTLVELMIVIAIIGVLAGAVLGAAASAFQEAKVARCKAQIAKLHMLIMPRWEAYGTRSLRLSVPPNTTDSIAKLARVRLLVVRDLMRMELPDRITDLDLGAVALNLAVDPKYGGGSRLISSANPAIWNSHRRRAGYAPTATSQPTWTAAHQGAECLYLIVAAIREGETNGLDFFKDSEIGDVDGDGLREILDPWGNPIEFMRWAPGFAIAPGPDGSWGVAGVDDDGNGTIDDFSELGWPGSDDDSELQSRDASQFSDPLDPLKVDPKWSAGLPASPLSLKPFALVPLIYSAGPDGEYEIASDGATTIDYRSPPTAHSDYASNILIDPYLTFSQPSTGLPGQLGRPSDVNMDGEFEFVDNITNHLLSD
jgi:prepilin-type N-terminal cleavage/methylation domain-containing protein